MRHGLEAVALDRHQRVAVAAWLFGDAQQARQRGAVDIGIQQSDFQAQPRQRQRQVDRDGGLADAAFAAGHRDDVLDAGNAGRTLAGMARLRRTGGWR